MVKTLDVNEAAVKLFGARDKHELLASARTTLMTKTGRLLPGLSTPLTEMLIALAERTRFESQVMVRTLQGDRIWVVLVVAFPPQPARLDRVLLRHTHVREQNRPN